jgi:hypothetical protein
MGIMYIALCTLSLRVHPTALSPNQKLFLPSQKKKKKQKQKQKTENKRG